MRKNFSENYRKFGHAFSKSFASPALDVNSDTEPHHLVSFRRKYKEERSEEGQKQRI
jgi:hypothetical protein